MHLISVYVSGVQGYWDLGNYVDTISSFIHLSIMRQETPVCEVLKIYQCTLAALNTQLNVKKEIWIIWGNFKEQHRSECNQTYVEENFFRGNLQEN